jgi:hypothetical protein
VEVDCQKYVSLSALLENPFLRSTIYFGAAENRVTRLGKFSPMYVVSFNTREFLENFKSSPNFWATLFHGTYKYNFYLCTSQNCQ